MKKNEYSSSLNGASFLLYELKQVVKLKLLGYSDPEVRKKVKEENLFQFSNPNRINRTLPSIMRRGEVLDKTLAHLLLESSLETSKVINLYTIMKTDILFYEFMVEVVGEKIQNNNFLLEKKDINVFFVNKAEQNQKVAAWSDINLEKLKRAYMQVLFESGMLRERQSNELTKLFIDPQIREHLINIGDHSILNAFGE